LLRCLRGQTSFRPLLVLQACCRPLLALQALEQQL
jgi:hypothetical protein